MPFLHCSRWRAVSCWVAMLPGHAPLFTSDLDIVISVGRLTKYQEVHYNQHGLLLLQGQGIYRLGNHW
jgi:glyoxylate utilization-related uncharacterized protein